MGDAVSFPSNFGPLASRRRGSPIVFSYVAPEVESVLTFQEGAGQVNLLIATVHPDSTLPYTAFAITPALIDLPCVTIDPGTAALAVWFNETNRELRLKGVVQPGQVGTSALTLGQGVTLKNDFNQSVPTANLELRLQITSASQVIRQWLGPFTFSTPYITYDNIAGKILFHPGPNNQRPVLQWKNYFGAGDYSIVWVGTEDSQPSNSPMELWLNGTIIQTFAAGVGTYSTTLSLAANDTLEVQMTSPISYAAAGKYVSLNVTKVSTGQEWDSYLDYINALGFKVEPWDYFYRSAPEFGSTRFELTMTPP